ncbi:aspartyl protease family protein [Qipengyuania spongiae]|uniref:Retropepsin-like domain-containing protein n=1 Tax=Qipengyuania spongiae TaxID=2909673 RepID=A0ABY5T013_9SPHN|nr:retropepsin-like aspartic protease [Qipengyuania spongiae]UVI38703.1 retropepsin-like domain-containing protein [Qipengyuania spongiae]
MSVNLKSLLTLSVASLLISVHASPVFSQELVEKSRVKVNISFESADSRAPLKFETIKGIILFEVYVNGVKTYGMLDNEIGRSVIDVELAQRLGLKISENDAKVSTQNGDLNQYVVDSVHVSLPGQLTIDAPSYAINLQGISRHIGKEIGFVLGKDYFSELIFIISNKNKSLRIGPPGSMNGIEGQRFLPVHPQNGTVPIEVDGEVFNLNIDTGSTESVGFRQKPWDRMGSATSRESFLMAAGSGRVSKVPYSRGHSISVNGHRLDDQRLSLTLFHGDEGDGVIGMGVLKNFDLVFNYSDNKIWVFPIVQ